MTKQTSGAMMETAAIEFRGVVKHFGEQRVLDGVDLQIPRGKTTVIIGGSGTGKSVTLKHMVGLMRPDAGSVLVNGEDLAEKTGREINQLLQRFGMLFQDGALFDSMNVGDNVAFPLNEHSDMSNEDIFWRVDGLLRVVGLEGIQKKMPSELSGGMRKRVGLARALALQPDVVLFDEPTSGLDPVMADAIDDLIKRTQEETGRTYVVISHDMEATFRIAHFIAMLHEGKIVARGTPDEIRQHNHPMLRRFLDRNGRNGADSRSDG